MPHLKLSASFLDGVARCMDFIQERNSSAAERARVAVDHALDRLESNPRVGRPYRYVEGARELSVPFGKGGYVILYRDVPQDDAVYLLDFRHQREAGYGD